MKKTGDAIIKSENEQAFIDVGGSSNSILIQSDNEVALNNTDGSTYQSVASLYTSGGPGIELNSQFLSSTYSKILILATGSTLLETADGSGKTSLLNLTPTNSSFGINDSSTVYIKDSNISFTADDVTIAVSETGPAQPASIFINKDVVLLTTPNTLYSAQQSGDLELRADTTLKLYSDYQNNQNMINMTATTIELSVANTHISNDLWLLIHSGGGTRYLTVDNNGQVGTTTGASPTVYSATFSDISTGTSSFPNNVGFEIGNIPAGNYLFYFGCWAQSSVITTLFADMKIYVQTTSSPVAIESSLMKWEGGDESTGLGVYADAKPFGYSGYPITLSATGTVSCNVIAARPAGSDSVGFYNSYMTIIKI